MNNTKKKTLTYFLLPVILLSLKVESALQIPLRTLKNSAVTFSDGEMSAELLFPL